MCRRKKNGTRLKGMLDTVKLECLYSLTETALSIDPRFNIIHHRATSAATSASVVSCRPSSQAVLVYSRCYHTSEYKSMLTPRTQ